jgi:predicted transcriptional regulator
MLQKGGHPLVTEAPPKPQPTQVRISPELRAQLKAIAERDGKKLYRVAEEAVAEYIKQNG